MTITEFWNQLLAEATDTETSAIQEAAIRAGLLIRCPICKWTKATWAPDDACLCEVQIRV